MRHFRWTSLALAGAVAAVVVTPLRAQQVELQPTAKPKRDKYVITAEEIAARPELSNAYEAVKVLRYEYLKVARTTGAQSGRSSIGGTPSEFTMKPPAGPGGGGTSSSPSSPPSASGAPVSGPSRNSGGESGFGDAPGGAAATTAVLYVDDIKQVSLEEMKNIRVAEIVEIRYLTSTQARLRFASGHEAGAILLMTNRIRRP
jgi:hypothetical protein